MPFSNRRRRRYVEMRIRELETSDQLRFLNATDVIIALPELEARWYNSRGRRSRTKGTPAEQATACEMDRAVAVLADQVGYQLSIPEYLTRDALSPNASMSAVISMRAMELRVFSAQLALRASTDAAPVIRLPYLGGAHTRDDPARRGRRPTTESAKREDQAQSICACLL